MSEQQYTQAEELADMQSGTVVYGGSRQPRTLFRLHGTGRHWIGEHGERYTDAEAAEELGEFESERPTPTREQIAEASAEALRDVAYVCGRVWEAWQVGTMSEDDFAPAWEDDELTGSIADAVLALLQKGADR